MRFRGVSIAMIGAATLLLAFGAPDAGAQGRRIGVLRPAPRLPFGGGAVRPRWGTLSPHFFTTCFVVPSFSFFPWFGGGMPLVNVQVFAGGQPAPDPTSHLTPNPGGQPVPGPGSHPVPAIQPAPGVQPVPGLQPVPGATPANPHPAPTFTAPVYSAPVYSAPVYTGATPVATPHVSNGMVVGDVIVDPTFALWGGSFFFGGGGIACVPTRYLGGSSIIR